MNKRSYVVISLADDNQIPYVEKHLDEPFVVLDTRSILAGDTYGFSFSDCKAKIMLDGQPLDGVRSVWYRRYMLVQGFELPVPEGMQLYAQRAARHFNRLIFAQFGDALWVSDFFAVEKADDKLWQMQKASDCGFRVPGTIITANPADAKAFVDRYGAVVAKSNYSSCFTKNGQEYVFYTSKVGKDTDFSGLTVAPAILQQAIDVKLELRVTVVGDKVFAAAVKCDDAKAAHHIRDWRVHNLKQEALIYEYDLSPAVHKRCRDLVKALGLKFGAMDLIIDHKDRLWFLENNAVGQWAFIEEVTGMPIGKAIADLLMSGRNGR